MPERVPITFTPECIRHADVLSQVEDWQNKGTFYFPDGIFYRGLTPDKRYRRYWCRVVLSNQSGPGSLQEWHAGKWLISSFPYFVPNRRLNDIERIVYATLTST